MNILDLARDIVNHQMLVLDDPRIQEADIRNGIRQPDEGELDEPPEPEEDATGKP